MIWFVVIAAALVVVALAWLLPPLLRRREDGITAEAQQGASNLAVIRDQLAELERDLASDALSGAQYQQAREELERRVLEEARVSESRAAQPAFVARRFALALAIAVPLGAAGLYWQFGTPGAISWTPDTIRGSGMAQHEVEAMVARLAARLETAPGDGDGWALLARSYVVMQRFGDAVAAYDRAAKLIPGDAALLADYADAVAMNQGRRIDGKALELIEEALRADPTQWKALALAGTAAFERKDYRQAVTYWEKLRQNTDPNSEIGRSVAASIAEARELGGIKRVEVPAPKAAAKPKAQAAGANVEGTVTLSAKLAGKAQPGDTVFVFARPADGSRMPLAIVRFQVKDLPLKFRLDDSQAMNPELKLSNHPEVVVGARLSKAGSATPQSGDLQGTSRKVKVGTTGVTVVIDSIVP